MAIKPSDSSTVPALSLPPLDQTILNPPNSTPNLNKDTLNSPPSTPSKCWTVFWHKVWNFLKYIFTCCNKCQKKEVEKPLEDPNKKVLTPLPNPSKNDNSLPPSSSFVPSLPSPVAEEKKQTPPATTAKSPKKKELPFSFPQELRCFTKKLSIDSEDHLITFSFTGWKKHNKDYLLCFSAQPSGKTNVCGCYYILIDMTKKTAQGRLRLSDFVGSDTPPLAICCPGPIVKTFVDIQARFCTQTNLINEKENPYGREIGRCFNELNRSYKLSRQIDAAVPSLQPIPKTRMSTELTSLLKKFQFWHLLSYKKQLLVYEWVTYHDSKGQQSQRQMQQAVSYALDLVKAEETFPPLPTKNSPQWKFKLIWDITSGSGNSQKHLGQIIIGFTENKIIVPTIKSIPSLTSSDEQVLSETRNFVLFEMRNFLEKAICKKWIFSEIGSRGNVSLETITVKDLEEALAKQ